MDILDHNDDNNQIHELSCHHSYHTKCILEWYKKNPNCPECRGIEPAHPIIEVRRYDLWQRSRILRRKSRNKFAPKELKKLVEKLKKFERKLKDVKKDHKEYLTPEMKEQRKIYKNKRNLIWRTESKIREIRREIGLFTHPDLGISNINVTCCQFVN